MEAKCYRCKETKSVSEFNKNRSRKSGVQSWCISCEHTYDNSRREKIRIRDARTSAIRAGVESTLTLNEWLEVLKSYQYQCAYCPSPYESMDHYIPFKLGGANVKENVVPACLACNKDKRSLHPVEWLLKRETELTQA